MGGKAFSCRLLLGSIWEVFLFYTTFFESWELGCFNDDMLSFLQGVEAFTRLFYQISRSLNRNSSHSLGAQVISLDIQDCSPYPRLSTIDPNHSTVAQVIGIPSLLTRSLTRSLNSSLTKSTHWITHQAIYEFTSRFMQQVSHQSIMRLFTNHHSIANWKFWNRLGIALRLVLTCLSSKTSD